MGSLQRWVVMRRRMLIMKINKEGSILMMANLRQRNPHHHLLDHLRPTDHLLCIDNTGWRWRR